MREKREDIAALFLYQLISTGLLCGIALFCFSGLSWIPGPEWKYLAALPVTVIFCFAIWMFNGRQRLYAVVIGGFVLLALFFSVKKFAQGDLFISGGQWMLLIKRVMGLSPGGADLLPEETSVIEWARIFLINIICYLLQLLTRKKSMIKMGLSVLAGVWLLYTLFWGQTAAKTGVLFVLSYIALSAAEYRRTRRKKMKMEDPHRFALGILPFIVLYFILLAFMPVRREPYDWQWVKNIYRSMEGKMTMYAENLFQGGDEYFAGAAGGFSETGGLFSDLAGDDREMMLLRIQGQKGMPVYLTGKVFHSFNGRTWESRGTGGGQEKDLDIQETVYALETYQEEHREEMRSNFLKTYQMEVQYRYLHTGYLMAPSKTLEIDGRKRRVRYHEEGGCFKFDQKAGYGTEYLLRFCRMDMDREEMLDFLEWSVPDRDQNRNSNRDQNWDRYRADIKELYLPETEISPEVSAWLSEVTADAKTDAEKLQSIEAALAEMKYDTSPGSLPETVTDGESYLDHFLLEKQQGYCVHFATAFVLLARAEGFPARYVQGFCVPAVSGEETPVYSGMAHAWPEVYIEGKGWIPFEPTPGFGENRYIPRAEDGGVREGTAFTENRREQGQESGAAPADEAAKEEEAEKQGQGRWRFYLGAIARMLAAGSILAFVIDWMAEKHREKRRSLGEKYRLAVLHNLQLLKMLGYGREPSQTYHELAERIRSGTSAEDSLPYGFIEAYENILYGTGEIGEQVLKDALEDKNRLFQALKKSRGRRYVFCRIRLYFTRYGNEGA